MKTKLIKRINYFEPGGSFENSYLGQLVTADLKKVKTAANEFTNRVVSNVRKTKKTVDDRDKRRKWAELRARKRSGILNDTARIQDELFKGGFYGDGVTYELAVDGIWGKATLDAYNRSKLKKLILSQQNDSEVNEDNLVLDFLQRTPIVRTVRHAGQTISNLASKVLDEARKGNYGKSAAASVGALLDLTTSIPSNVFGYNMYTAPFKDIVNSQYNRAVRNITGDLNYTAIKGLNYGKHDMSKGMWDATIEMQQRVANGEDSRLVADEMAKRVNPGYNYSSASLLFHPLNDTANYLWTIGGLGEATGDKYSDFYDNNKNKTESYLKSLERGWRDGSSITSQAGRAIRGFAGLMTSLDEDPDEQKQAVIIPKQKKK